MSAVDEILSNIDIIDVVSPYIEQLDEKSGEWSGLCPFHSEKTPSFYINPEENGVYHCFGCGVSGNIITFLEEVEDKDFIEIMHELSDISGIPFTETKLSEEEIYRKHLQEIMQKLAGTFNFALTNMPKHRKTYENILERRKLSFDDLKTFDIGYSDREVLDKFMKANSVTPKDKIATGAYGLDKKTGDIYTTINSRITFPLKRLNGDIVGFTGERTLSESYQSSKYKISVPSGLEKDYFYYVDKIKNNKPFYLCEGLYDVISLKLAGVDNAISTLGTNVTDQQIERMLEKTNRFVLVYDGDSAGMHASKTIYHQLKRLDKFGDVDIQFVFIPNKLDPDDCRKSFGLDLFTQLIQHPLTPISFMLRLMEQDNDLAGLSQVDTIRHLSAIYATFARDDIEKNVYFNKLAEKTDIDKSILEQYGVKEYDRLLEKDKKHSKQTNEKMFANVDSAEEKQAQTSLAQAEPSSNKPGSLEPSSLKPGQSGLDLDIGALLGASSVRDNTSLDELEDESNSVLFIKEKSILNYLAHNPNEIKFVNSDQVFYHEKIQHFYDTLKSNYVKLNSDNETSVDFFKFFSDKMLNDNTVDGILWEDIKYLDTTKEEYDFNLQDVMQHGSEMLNRETHLKQLESANSIEEVKALMAHLREE